MQQIRQWLGRMIASQNTDPLLHFFRDILIIGFWLLLGTGLSFWGVNSIKRVHGRFVAGWYTPEVNAPNWIFGNPEIAIAQLSVSILVIALSVYMAIHIIRVCTDKLNGSYKDICIADLITNTIIGKLSMLFKVVVHIAGFVVCVLLAVNYYTEAYDLMKNPETPDQYIYPFININLDGQFALIVFWVSIGTLAIYGAIRIAFAGLVSIAKFTVNKIDRDSQNS